MTGREHDDMLIRHAAVLIPLVEENGTRSLLFEVRAYDLDVQPGDVCFPGGSFEGSESADETAVRETCEELLITPSQITLLHTLPEINGPGAVVTPCVGMIRDYAGTFSTNEVDHVFTVPLSWFAENAPVVYPARYVPQLPADFPYEKIHGGKNYPFRTMRHDILFYDIPAGVRTVCPPGKRAGDGHALPVLWGFTAKLTRFFVQNEAAV